MSRAWLSLLLCGAGPLLGEADFPLQPDRVGAVHGGRLTFESGGSVVLKSQTAEYGSGLRLLPPAGESAFDLSSGRYLVAEVESLASHQQRICLQIKDAVRDTYAGTALDPGETATIKLQLPHDFIYGSPEGAKGVRTLDTAHITNISFQVIWPYEGQFSGLLNVRLSRVRLEGTPDYARRVGASAYLPFVDAYGQYVHGD